MLRALQPTLFRATSRSASACRSGSIGPLGCARRQEMLSTPSNTSALHVASLPISNSKSFDILLCPSAPYTSTRILEFLLLYPVKNLPSYDTQYDIKRSTDHLECDRLPSHPHHQFLLARWPEIVRFFICALEFRLDSIDISSVLAEKSCPHSVALRVCHP